MKEYLERQIEGKKKERKKWEILLIVCTVALFAFYIVFGLIVVFSSDALKESIGTFLAQRTGLFTNLGWTLIGLLVFVAISSIPFIKKNLEIGKLRKQIEKGG